MKNSIYLFAFLALISVNSGCSDSKTAVSILNNPASSHSKYPFLYATKNRLYMSWITHYPEEEKNSLNYARYSNGEWGKIHTIANGSSWFVNWADFPSIIADSWGPIAAHWLNKISGGTYAYNVNISLSSNDQWTSPITPHTDSTATEHGFVSMIPWNDDAILAVWLDGRQSANDTPQEYYDIDNAMTLRGALISTSGTILESFLIDDSVCDCCQTSLVKTAEGALVAYRNRTENEIRDIYVSRFNGTKWSTPEVVYNDHWKISACPVNGPKLASGNSLIAVAWPTAAGNRLTIKASISTDGGNTFNDPIIVSRNSALGRVDAAIHNNKIYISWIQKEEKDSYIKLARFDSKGSSLKKITVAKINGSRMTSFPQLEAFEDQLIMAWTAIDSASATIKTVQVDLSFSE